MMLFLGICFVSCGGDDSGSDNSGSGSTSSQSSLKGLKIDDVIVASSKTSVNVSFGNANLSTCKVQSSTSWCSASISNSNVVITVQENDTNEDRTSTITVTDTKDNTQVSFSVIQKQNNAITIGSNVIEVPESGGAVSIEVKSNVDYEVDLSGIDWIRLTPQTRAMQTSTVNLTVDANTSGKAREAVVKIKSKDGILTSNVKIIQSFTAILIIEGISSFEVPEDGGEVLVEVKSNIDFDIDLSEIDWVKINSQTRNLETSTIKLLVDANTSGKEREAVVKIISKDGSITRLVTIKQSFTPIVITPASISMYYDDTYQLSAEKAKKWSIDDDFIAKVDENGLVTGRHVGKTIITASNDYSSGSCAIEIKPKYTLFGNPILKWGASMSEIKASETHAYDESYSSSTTLAFNYGFGSTTCYALYMFKEEGLYGIMIMMPYSNANYLNVGYYLIERFQPIGQDGNLYLFIDAMTIEKTKTTVGFEATGTGSSRLIQILYTYHTNTSSNSKQFRAPHYMHKDKDVVDRLRKHLGITH